MDTKKTIETIDQHIGKKALMKPFGRAGSWLLLVPRDQMLSCATVLRQEKESQFDVAETVSVHVLGDKYHLSYFLSSTHHGEHMVLRCEGLTQEIDSIEFKSLSSVWGGIDLKEKEQAALFGIRFDFLSKSDSSENSKDISIDFGLREGDYPLRKNFLWEDAFL